MLAPVPAPMAVLDADDGHKAGQTTGVAAARVSQAVLDMDMGSLSICLSVCLGGERGERRSEEDERGGGVVQWSWQDKGSSSGWRTLSFGDSL